MKLDDGQIGEQTETGPYLFIKLCFKKGSVFLDIRVLSQGKIPELLYIGHEFHIWARLLTPGIDTNGPVPFLTRGRDYIGTQRNRSFQLSSRIFAVHHFEAVRLRQLLNLRHFQSKKLKFH
jgi:hypothetical protein